MSYERGDTFTAGLTLTTNFNDLYATWLDEPEPELRPNGSNKTTDYSS
ncbi:outer membrane lipoprotein YmcA [Vibrio sp. JCM 19236]|nr:outer membrane lipoprotein YmcA [Vibrio sp. JCM 19236]